MKLYISIYLIKDIQFEQFDLTLWLKSSGQKYSVFIGSSVIWYTINSYDTSFGNVVKRFFDKHYKATGLSVLKVFIKMTTFFKWMYFYHAWTCCSTNFLSASCVWHLKVVFIDRTGELSYTDTMNLLYNSMLGQF